MPRAKRIEIKTHIFNRKKYKIFICPFDGLCDTAPQKDGSLSLYILVDLSTKDGLITAVHEALHAEDGGMSESKVDKMANEIGGFLWRLGFRLKV